MEKKKIVAIASCAAGIAHTYMAANKLKEGAQKLGFEIKVETQGSVGAKSILTDEDIKNADLVILAVDVDVEKKRFIGKKLVQVSTNTAMKDPVKLIGESLENAKIFYGKGEKVGGLTMGTSQNKLMKAIMTAISYMLPIVIAGGLLMAIPNALAAGGDSKGGTWHFPNQFTAALWQFGHWGLIIMVPVLAMYIAYAIGGKPAMPAALFGAWFINDPIYLQKFSPIDLPEKLSGGAGFLGGLIVGIAIGYLVLWMKWINWPKFIKPVEGLMIIPLISTFISFVFVTYAIGGPMTWLTAQLYIGLKELNDSSPAAAPLIGMLFAMLIAVDLGGPINKTALVVATVIFADTLKAGDTNFVPQTAAQAAISVPPLGMFIATKLFKKKFSRDERIAGDATLPMGMVGISEGALPFAFKRPLKTIASCVIGSGISGLLVTLFNIKFYGGLGSPLGAYVGYMQNSFYGLLWIGSVLSGAIITGVMFGLLVKKDPVLEANYLVEKQSKIDKYNEQGLTTKKQIFNYNVKYLGIKLGQGIKSGINPKNWFKNPNLE